MRKYMFTLVVMGLVTLSGVAWGAPSGPHKYSFKMRLLIEAKYGDGIDEFRKENFEGVTIGAICLDVDCSGRVYIYDAIKGDIKVYDPEGKYLKTIDALPWIVGEQVIADMGVTPEGDIWLAVESEKVGERVRIFRISGKDGELTKILVGLDPGFLTWNGIPVWLGILVTADCYGDVYLMHMDRGSWKTTTLAKGGRILSPEEQLASSRTGEPVKSGFWVETKKILPPEAKRMGATSSDPNGNLYGPHGVLFFGLDVTVFDKSGKETAESLRVAGPVEGIDSRGDMYVHLPRSSTVQVRSPRNEVEAVIDFPKMHFATEVFGKGGTRLVAPDGSIYQLVVNLDNVRVYKWERGSLESESRKGE